MKQSTLAEFKSSCGKIKVLCESDTTLGAMHDFLVQMKGLMLEQMIQAQKKEAEEEKSEKSESSGEE